MAAVGVGTVAAAAVEAAAGTVAAVETNSSCDSFFTTVVYLRISCDNVEVICSDGCNNRKHVN